MLDSSRPSVSSPALLLWGMLAVCTPGLAGCPDPPSGNPNDLDADMSSADMPVAAQKLVLLLDGAPYGGEQLEVESSFTLGVRALDAKGQELDTSSATFELKDTGINGAPVYPGPGLVLGYDGQRLSAHEIGWGQLTATVGIGVSETFRIQVKRRGVPLVEPSPILTMREDDILDLSTILRDNRSDSMTPLLPELCDPQQQLVTISGALALQPDSKSVLAAHPGVGRISFNCGVFGMANGGQDQRTYYVRVRPRAELSAGPHQTCAIVKDGESASQLRCWGRNDLGQLGTGVGRSDLPLPSLLPDVLQPSHVDMSVSHGCAVDGSKDIYCWGDNTHKAVSTGMEDAVYLEPVLEKVEYVSFVQACATASTSCGLSERGRLICWGTNTYGLLGASVPADTSVSARIEPFPDRRYHTLACGTHHACATTLDGKSECWGDNSSGQLGVGSDEPFSAVPRKVVTALPNTSFTRLAAGDKNSCGVTDAGELYCWGDNSSGQLAGATLEKSSKTPVRVDTIKLNDVSVWGEHICGVAREDGQLLCWGDNTFAQLAVDPVERVKPEPAVAGAGVFAGKRLSGLAVSERHSCAFDKLMGELYCWGDESNGRLGQGSAVLGLSFFDRSSPSLTNFSDKNMAGQDFPGTLKDLALGDEHGCVLDQGAQDNIDDDRVLCWGSNAKGQLLDAATIHGGEHAPYAFTFLTRPINALSAGGRHTCALRGDPSREATHPRAQKVRCWGDTSTSQAGPAGPLANIADASFSISPPNNVGLERQNTTTTPQWGALAGTLADTSTCGIGPFEQVRMIIPGLGEQIIIDGGRPFCWGQGDVGELGKGNQLTDTTPLPDRGVTEPPIKQPLIGNLTGSNQLQCGWENTATALTRLYCWGHDPTAIMAEWSGTPASDRIWYNPQRVFESGSNTMRQFRLNAVAIGDAHACAITQQGSEVGLVCWGDNSQGQLGVLGRERATMQDLLEVEGVGEPLLLTSGDAHTCVSNASNEIYCWGANHFGQVGAVNPQIGVAPSAHVVAEPYPVLKDPALRVVDLKAGAHHTCALLQDSVDSTAPVTVHCWGENSLGQSSWSQAGSWSRQQTPVAITWE